MTTPIIILFLLLLPLIIASLHTLIIGHKLDVHRYALYGLGLCFFFFSIGHFIKTQGMVDMLPPWIPLRTELIYATGILEIVIAITLFIRKYQIKAAKLAIIVFITFLPVNIYAAIHETGLGGHQWGPSYLLIRIPLQLILIGWAYFLCFKKSPQE